MSTAQQSRSSRLVVALAATVTALVLGGCDDSFEWIPDQPATGAITTADPATGVPGAVAG